MPRFDQVRGVEPSAPEYEEVKVRRLEIRTKDGQTADFALEDGDTWSMNEQSAKVYIHLEKNNEDVVFFYNQIIYVSARDAIVRRPKEFYKPTTT